MSHLARARAVFDVELAGVRAVRGRLDASFDQAVEAVVQTLRQQMARDEQALDRPLARVMTRRPVCIREDALAAEALRVFHARSIDDLIVVNIRREPVGLVDSQDLPKLKLM